MDRVVALVDMDCFYCQVETRLNPTFKGKPLAVVQYNKWKGGGIIAVNYEARDFGVTRSMRGDEAKKKCPDIILVHVPAVRGKADLTKYRDAGREVVDVFCQFSDCVQRASVDEAYIDITKAVEQRMCTLDQVQPSQLATTFVVGYTDVNNNDEGKRIQGLKTWLENIYDLQDPTQQRLAVAGVIVEEMRAAVFQQTGFRCSAGIAHNKILGKLACGLHKPNRQSILPKTGVAELYKTLPVNKVRNLGGKFGCVVVEELGCKVMADLLQFTENQLQNKFDEKTGTWLYNIARGIDLEPVTQCLISKSFGCCKKFPGNQALATKKDVLFWISELSTEVTVRLNKDLEENKRRAKLLTVSYQQDVDSRIISSTRSGALNFYNSDKIAADALELIKKSNTGQNGQDSWYPPLKYLGVSVSKFIDETAAQSSTIHNFFKAVQKETVCSDLIVDKYSSGSKLIDSSKQGTVMSGIEQKNKCKVNSISFKNSNIETPGKSFFKKFLNKETDISSNETCTNKTSGYEINSSTNLVLNNASSTINKNSDTNSDDDMFESQVPGNKHSGEKLHVNFDDSETIQKLKPEVSSLIDRQQNENDDTWISLGEIFPDVSNIDDDVIALLPEQLQKKLQARIERIKHDTRNDSMTTSVVADLSDSSHTQSDSETQNQQVTKVVEACIHKNEVSGNINVVKNIYRECNSDKIPNQLSKPSRQKDIDVLCESRHNFQGTKLEDEDLIEICNEEEISSKQDPSVRRISITNEFQVSETDPIQEGDEMNVNIVTEKCSQCGEEILLSEFPEHLDFHAAEKLHKELNEVTQVKTVTQKNSSIELPVKRKRGRPGKGAVIIGSDKKMKSIKAFFTPK